MKKRNLFMSLMLMCGLLAMAFTFEVNNIHWFWSESKPVGVLLGVLTLVFAVFFIRSLKIANR